MTVHPTPGTPVELKFAGRNVQGVVDDVRWSPSWNNTTEEIVVDADGTIITTGRANISPR
ncbi:hypothetical protein [Natrarchaeobaculum sulfurireducens]|uniref:Uncharacterized protein n=1 Tax=Natrarchaeobaculum sulfurireducens TaxID=2044521 RepID=A0A346PMQ6_9EURY|nr:hypothetical protein [Natrarchaeobaculum sulfurireducens]AXR80801.1 hypothetical protein AArcMg_0779 [Natrarchaeobaculum sulfurireducens]